MLIIGETLNASIEAVRQAILTRDEELVTRLAREQVEAGANMLDVNAGAGGEVLPVNKVSLLMPWIGLAIALALAGVYGARSVRRKVKG